MPAGRTTRDTFDLARGDRVRVRTPFASVGGGRFETGQVLRFERSWFSVYDDADVYRFVRADGTTVDWFVAAPAFNVCDDWPVLFERVAT